MNKVIFLIKQLIYDFMKFLYCKFLIFSMVLSDQRTPYSIMYVGAAFDAKSPPTRQDLVTLINNYTL
jgi:hypothetical protein